MDTIQGSLIVLKELDHPHRAGATLPPIRMTGDSDTLNVRSLPDLIYERLRHDIATGVLQPGRLRISQLATRFGVSAIPIREALRLLEAHGLVSFQENRSVVINAVSVEDVVENFAIRAELECLALRLSLPRLQSDPPALAQLDALVKQMDAELRSPEDWRTTNERFHTALYEPADSPRLASLISTLWVTVEPYLRLYVTAASSLELAQQQHRRFVTYARKGDVENAQSLLREHLRVTQEVVIERIATEPADGATVDP